LLFSVAFTFAGGDIASHSADAVTGGRLQFMLPLRSMRKRTEMS
jgi:hypothetical protein